MINAIHINSTQPFFQRNPKKEYIIEDYDILTTILSALYWRKNNGKITMYTTNEGKKYYEKLNITEVWNDINTEALENYSEEIDFNEYWAAGKIMAVRNEKSPFVMLDTDMIFWEEFLPLIKGRENKTICIHKEGLKVYADKEKIKVKDGYEFDLEWDWSIEACNTAFVYFGNEELRRYYTDEFFKFIDGNKGNLINDNKSQIVFAEQRMIAMCGKKIGNEIDSFSTYSELMEEDKKGVKSKFTHIWGFKVEIKKEITERAKYCIKCMQIIKSEFPEYQEMIFGIPQLQVYIPLIEIIK